MHSLYSLTTTPIKYIFQNSLTEKIVLKADDVLGQSIYSVWDTGYLEIEVFKNILANFSYFAATMSGYIVLLDNFWFVCISVTVIISLTFNLRFLYFPSFLSGDIDCCSFCTIFKFFTLVINVAPMVFLNLICHYCAQIHHRMLECPLLGRFLPQYRNWNTDQMRFIMASGNWTEVAFLKPYPDWFRAMFAFKYCWWNLHKYIHIFKKYQILYIKLIVCTSMSCHITEIQKHYL